MAPQTNKQTICSSPHLICSFNGIHSRWSLQGTVGADMTFKFLKTSCKHTVEKTQNGQPTTNYMTPLSRDRQQGAVNVMSKILQVQIAVGEWCQRQIKQPGFCLHTTYSYIPKCNWLALTHVSVWKKGKRALTERMCKLLSSAKTNLKKINPVTSHNNTYRLNTSYLHKALAQWILQNIA